jgi:hypothetical protein
MGKVKANVDVGSGTIEAKEKKRKLRSSIWKIMINTHLSFPDLVTHTDNDGPPNLENYARNHKQFGIAYNKFKEVLGDMFGEDLEHYITVKEDGIEALDDQYFNVPDAKVVIEIGPKSHQLHSHIYLRVNHRTKIALKYDEMKAAIKETMGLAEMPAFSAKWITPGEAEMAELYVLKTQ